ncbi:MAG: hypothetical protein A2X12_00985 [Bacteroidetes bacterium GWE2_29_8]|nr:MAG: hypothetical protein A2X12_00985 [Bacteroidetes bacterium GWE2_29_8]OFY15129.1 MAG: hypothetical protein A2X02_06525 [Bacteroidetes bacterium GWF2_29_10]
MPVIYLNNFRGFDDTFLELKNVNFFVGENSTGKTSVLKLLNIVSNPQFWFNTNFNIGESSLGHYSEIASLTNKKLNFFEIGILGDHRDKQDGISAIKLKFIEIKSIPRLSELRMIDRGIDIQVIVKEDELEYCFETINLKKISEENKLKNFRVWIKKNNLNNQPSKIIKQEKGHNVPILFIPSLIKSHSNKDDRKLKTSEIMAIPRFLKELVWLAPIRTEPQRTYDNYSIDFNPAGTHSPYLLKDLLNSSKNITKYNKIFKKFGEDSGLFEGIEIIKLGKEETSPFEVHIKLHDKSLKVTNVGYGVSQILPLIIEIIARKNNSWFAIQQPEIHLHPKGQAAFGDFIFKSHKEENKNFIVETHSDYLIDRFRLRLNKECKSSKDCKIESQVVFFERNEKGNKLTCIPINQDGTYPEEQPKEFRKFFINEMLDLLKV